MLVNLTDKQSANKGKLAKVELKKRLKVWKQ